MLLVATRIRCSTISISLASSFNCIEAYQKEIKAIDKAIFKAIQGMSPNALTILSQSRESALYGRLG